MIDNNKEDGVYRDVAYVGSCLSEWQANVPPLRQTLQKYPTHLWVRSSPMEKRRNFCCVLVQRDLGTLLCLIIAYNHTDKVKTVFR